MTRFARALGSKSSNKKVPEESTPWRELIKKVKCSNDKTDSSTFEKKHISRKPIIENVCCDKSNAWSIVDDTCTKRKRKRIEGYSKVDSETLQFKKSKACEKPTRWQLSDEDKIVLNKLKEKLLSKGMNVQVINSRVEEKVKQLKAKSKKKKCFKCQTSNHIYKDCPERNDHEVCFACGSTEHRVKDCRQKKKQCAQFAFATCFICKEQGHISSACPDNPTGLYPFGGGCHECGEVTHFSRNCPRKKKETSKNQFTLDLLSNDVEGLPEDNPTMKVKKSNKLVKVVNF